MKMDFKVCRLCLGDNNLRLIFENTEQSDEYSRVLEKITGIKITPNDDFPKEICLECTNFINQAIVFRQKCQETEIKLQNLNIPQSSNENTITEINESIDVMDDNDFDRFQIKIEIDRLTEEETVKKGPKANDSPKKQPVKKNQRAAKRELYLSMIEGDFNPNGPLKCNVCKTTLSKWNSFIHHAQRHLGSRCICEFCGKSCLTAHQLKRHCRSFHGLEREMKCKRCSFLALDKAQLSVHERRMHTGERPYQCDTCGASYFSRKCLVQHIENHRTTATVKCDQCNALFKSKRHLAKHRYGAHTDKRRARRHEKRHAHKEKVNEIN